MTNLIASDQKRLIIGMGQTGLSCARFLTEKGLSFDLCDTRELLPNQADIESEFPQCQIFKGELDAEILVRYQELIVSPGIAIAEPAIVSALKQGSRVRGDVDIFAEYVTKPIIGITGSNGKSTVTTLVGEILAAGGHKPAVCGNIGIPVLEVLLNDDHYDCYVVELSSFQLETTHHLAAEVACVLNMSEDHMDRYNSMMAYYQAKHRIFQGCRNIVVNREDALTQPLVSTSMPKKSFGLQAAENPVAAKNQYAIALQKDKANEVNLGEFLMFEQQPIFPVAQLKIKGRHNQLNALAAIALVESLPADFEVNYDQLHQVLSDFTGLPHRCSWVAEHDNVEYFNDSKGTNVGSTLAAIEGLASNDSKNIILIAGGVGKDQDFEPLADACQLSVKQAVLFGRDASLIASSLVSTCELNIVETLEQALIQAREVSCPGDVILFSPACASFDQFANYVKRGEVFEQLVAEIISNKEGL
ncbi:MAG: UDP-N-acetylmuramoylalanine--D-glutamate ligase [Oleispira sp.]|jgi:UDP-N-acetylmuramoylalanine--D-glutamate ligase